MSTCGEVDSLAKAIGTHFFPEADLNNCTISKWGYYLCQSFPGIDTKVLQFKNGMQVKPFDSWQQTIATNKKGQTIYVKAPGSKRLQWWTDYNTVKHSRASIDPDRGLANYEKANQGNVIKAMGALFLLNRLMMQRLDADAYQAIERSKLFKLCNSPDETVTFICYGSKGVPLQITHKAQGQEYRKQRMRSRENGAEETKIFSHRTSTTLKEENGLWLNQTNKRDK